MTLRFSNQQGWELGRVVFHADRRRLPERLARAPPGSRQRESGFRTGGPPAPGRSLAGQHGALAEGT